MGKRRFEHRAGILITWTAMLLGPVVLAGCAMPSWPWGSSPHKISPDTDAKATPLETTSSPPKSSASQADSQSLQQAVGELQQVAALDPAEREKLMADLKQVDPGLQTMFLQTVLAEAAYRRREKQLEGERQKEETAAKDAPPDDPGAKAKGAALPETRFELKSPRARSIAGSSSEMPSPPAPLPSTGEGSKRPVPSTGEGSMRPPPSSPATASPNDHPALAPEPPMTGGIVGGSAAAIAAATPGEAFAAAAAEKPGKAIATAAEPLSTAALLAATRGQLSANSITPIGFAAPIAAGPGIGDADWQSHLTAAIRSIESESKAGSKNESDVALQARLRMLYLLAGRRDDAMRPLPAAPQASQDYWSSQIYGLSTWMDSEKTPDMGRRAAETKRILGEALAQLGETAPLAIRNLTFCNEVFRFGAFDALKTSDFTPGQKVLLYAEIDNLHIESAAKGYRWAVKVNGQIFDNRGNRMTDYGSASFDEYFQTQRHDFFVSKLYYLPHLAPGRYSLLLTIEDTLGHKVGQSSIDFTVKPQ